MIKYNSQNINDWDFGDDNIVKVYRNGAVVYYKVTNETPTPPSFDGKFKLTYQDESVYSAECDSTSAITQSEVTSGSSSHSAITNAIIGDCVTEIGENAFEECSSLTSVTIAEGGLQTIEDRAFNNCENLSSITFPNSLTYFGRNAFDGCYSLTSLDIPSGVTSIPMQTFENCISLSSITVDNNNTTYDSRNNCNAIIKTSNNALLFGCKNTVIPNTVTTLSANSFNNCTGLTSISIPDSVQRIDTKAFYACKNLSNLTIGSGVTTIGNYAFSFCSGMTSVVLGNSVATIHKSAFDNCRNLGSISLPSSIRTVNNGSFSSCYNLSAITINNLQDCTITSLGNLLGGNSANIYTENCDVYAALTLYSNVPSNRIVTSLNFQTRWTQTQETMCDGGDSYWVDVQEYSCDGINWTPTTLTQKGALKESGATECQGGDGYVYSAWRVYQASGEVTSTIELVDTTDNVSVSASTNMHLRGCPTSAETSGNSGTYSISINSNDKIDSICFIAKDTSSANYIAQGIDTSYHYDVTSGACTVTKTDGTTAKTYYVLAKWKAEDEEPTNVFTFSQILRFRVLAIGINQEDSWGEAYTVGNP